MKWQSAARVVLLTLIIAVFPTCDITAQQNALTLEHILSLKSISDVQLSPDGKRILFHVARPRRHGEAVGKPLKEIWMLPVEGGDPYRFTYNDKSDNHARWSPDGKTIAFISKRGGSKVAQISLISPDGGAARQLTDAENSVGKFKWSPDGSMIAYTMKDAKTDDEVQSERVGIDWIVADQDYKHTRLYAIKVSTRENWKISNADITVWDFDWSPDARRLVLQATETPKVDDRFMNSKLMIVNATGGAPALLVATEGKVESPRWSHDGKYIAWRGATKRTDPYAGSVFVVSMRGGEPENLTPDWGGTAIHIQWLGKPDVIVVCALERQSTVLRTIKPGSRKFSPLLVQPIIYSDVSFSSGGRWMALAANTPAHPNELYFGKTESGTVKRLTHVNPHIDRLVLASQEVVKWEAYDGLEIEGVFVKPVNYVKGERYPLFVQFHGGPESAERNGWLGSHSRWGQLLAANGIAVLYPNYRGSIGRGVRFSELDQKDMLGKEFEDALAGIDFLVREGIVDNDRVGLGGGSYGGYAGAWAATKFGHRFKLAIVWKGVSNRVSKVGTADNHQEETSVHWTVDLYDNYDLYWDRSPIKHINNARTPTLILHGEKDRRVPVSQGLELYTALKWKGVPVEYVVYPRERHDVVERAHQKDFLFRVLTWCELYLKDSTLTR